MPSFDIEELKRLSRTGMWTWSQQDVDLVTSYLFSRGWRPPKSYGDRPFVRRVPYVLRHEVLPNGIEITRARFREPVGTAMKGAEKALKQAVKMERHDNHAKDLAAQARKALSDKDFGLLDDLLSRLEIVVGG